ncbi:MAG: NUDIX hydrolase, partial [SAR86 cluster bacterium]|nr:NUDIX hydrolase [SAR86 cluster bacterium]
MKYCSDCGSSKIKFITPEGDHVKRYICSECENIFYTNPNMVVGALCVRGEKILMAKRNIHPRKGMWTLPAGFMENAETLQQGALRETFEETGSHAKVIQPYTLFSLPHINQVHMFFLADLLDENFG